MDWSEQLSAIWSIPRR